VIPYADSNFFTRLYLPIIGAVEATALLARVQSNNVPALPCSVLHRIEVMNAFQLHVFAGKSVGQQRITLEQAAAAHVSFLDDVRERRFIRGFDLISERFEELIEELSLRHSARHGFRAYDLMHVASARLLGCDTFLSFDQKARKLAELEGLELA
jgi:predicted nucleic acid-binding protein